jgi:pyruvate dehydrogenase E2 component (dihydrolipoamide acetyltransferase)
MATPVIMPRQGQSVETCILAQWYKKKGDMVNKGEIILSYETDKAAFELESPASGTILEIFYQDGEEVRVLSNIAVIGQPEESVAEFRPVETALATGSSKNLSESEVIIKADASRQTGADTYTYSSEPHEIKISPRARSLAGQLNVPLSGVRGTGPDGRILERDIEIAAATLRTTPLASEVMEKEDKATGTLATGPGGQFRSVDLVTKSSGTTDEFVIKKISNIRRIIAENMHASLQNSAQLTHHLSADARKILEYRKMFKSGHTKEFGENITIPDMVCYAVIKALIIKPEINSHFLGDSIKTFHKVHLGIAVDTERGLMVPALRNADEMSLPELSSSIKSLADQCRKGNIDPELLAGKYSSFTVSNLGNYGIEMFTPVLNIPQTGILGVNTIIYRPADLGDGEIGFIPVIGLSLTYDHRAIDGAPASVFLKEVKQQIEDFEIKIR